jgi:hypothetical protein
MIFKTGFTSVIYISKTKILICVNLRCLRNPSVDGQVLRLLAVGKF